MPEQIKLPLVSVIIPMYNSEKYIAQTLESIFDQSYPNIEVIVVDDGSTDDSLRVATAAKNDRTAILTQANKGASAARNTGLAVSTGAFVQFIDADDLLSKDKIEQQVAAILVDDLRLAVCSTVHFADSTSHRDASPSPYEEAFLINTKDPVYFLIKLMGGFSEFGSMIPIHSWLVSRKLIELTGPWNETLSMDDDGEYFCRVVLNAKEIVKTGGLSYYRRSQANRSLSSQTNLKSYESMLKSYTLRKQHLLERSVQFEAKAGIYKLFMNLAVGSYIQYPEISNRAIAALPVIKIKNYMPSVGGPTSTFLAKIFGWRAIKKFQNYYYQLRKKR